MDHLAVETKNHLNLPHYLPASGVGLQDLPNPGPKDPAQGIKPLATVFFDPIVLQGADGQKCAEALFDLAERGLAQPPQGFLGGARPHGGEALNKLREKWRDHRAVYIPPLLTKAI